jgi:hypothetical protein
MHPKYNVDQEICNGLRLVDEGLTLVDDIKLAFALGENLTDVFHLIHLIYPPFDPLRTVGKY